MIQNEKKTIIGVLASHDATNANQDLVRILNWLCNTQPAKLEKFHFLFTGGTFDRVVRGMEDVKPISPNSVKVLEKCGVTRLPTREEGGVPIFSFFVSQRICSIVWGFWAPYKNHWLRPENLALMRLCDQWHVKRLMNSRSVQIWFDYEAENDAVKNLQSCPPKLIFRDEPDRSWEKTFDEPDFRQKEKGISEVCERSVEKSFEKMTIALIAHDDMKSRMIDFAIDHESELRKFGNILTTGTTGREVAAATSRVIEDKIYRYHSGPKGGDIEIATEIVYGKCDIVIFFVDPLKPHPHREDILVVFQSCMVTPEVLMITNEMHAREFMTNVVRGREGI